MAWAGPLCYLLALLAQGPAAVAVSALGGSPPGGSDAGLAPPSLLQRKARARPAGGVAEALRAVGGRRDLPRRLRTTLLQALRHGRRGKALRLGRGGARKEDREAAREMLSQLVEETTQKLDLERVRCSEYQERQQPIMGEAWQDITEFRAAAAAARGKILRSQYALRQARMELPKLEDSLSAHRRKCNFVHDSLQGQIQMLATDLGTLSDLGACTPATAALLQCHMHKRRGHQQGKILVSFGHAGLRRNISRVRSKFARATLQEALQRAYAAAPGGEALTALLETGRRHRRGHLGRAGARGSRSGLNSTQCMGVRNAACDEINSQFLKVQAKLMDKWEDLKEEMARVQTECESTVHAFDSQMATFQNQQRDGDVALAEGTKSLNLNEEQLRLKNLQVADLKRDFDKTVETCQVSLDSFEGELCNLRTVRVEVEKMSGGDGAIQDCAVTDWVPEACSVTCGGGIQVLRRQSVSPPVGGGAECPPLQLQRKCNEQACPVDCELDSWSEWSSCSAMCGGGVRQRIRNMKVEPAHGGLACEETGETEGCNLESCERECELSDWSEWSECSKMCGTGSQVRGKEVMVEALGSGKCPNSDARLEYMPCNAKSCTSATAPDDGVLCQSKLDVVLAIDGSGFNGEGDWDRVLNGSSQLLNRFAGGVGLVRVGVLLFSGPHNLATYRACTQGMGQAPDLEKDCRFTWVSHLTEDIAAAATAVSGLAQPGGAPLTGRAVMTAMQELKTGRRDAESIVVVVTDSAPLSARAMDQVAVKVRGTARLMWVPVLPTAPLEQIRTWASRPVDENVVPADGVAALDKPSTITRIIANICPKLSGVAKDEPAANGTNAMTATNSTTSSTNSTTPV